MMVPRRLWREDWARDAERMRIEDVSCVRGPMHRACRHRRTARGPRD